MTRPDVPSDSPRRSARLAKTGSMWVVRHGERADVADWDWWLTADRPHDPPLTPLGKKQASAAGDALVGQPVECIYSSPFRRCIQTSIEIADALGGDLKIKIEPGLGEMLHHDWFDFPAPNERSGNPVNGAMSTEALVETYGANRIDASHTPIFDVRERSGINSLNSSCEYYTFPEHWHDGIARYQATLRKLQTMSPYSVLVTHGAGVQACAESVDGIDMEDMEIGYCCLTNLKRQGTSEAKEAWKMGMLAVDKHTAGLESMRTNFR